MFRPKGGGKRRRAIGETSSLVPAASSAVIAQAAEQQVAEIQAAIGESLNKFEARLGGRQELIDVLAQTPLTSELHTILGLLADPQYDRMGLSRLCLKAGVTAGDVFLAYKRGLILRGQLLATQKVSAGLPAVAEDVMRRSAPYQVTCGACIGTGSIVPEPTPEVKNPSPIPCSLCLGTGQRTIEPDLDRQKLALDLGEMVKKGGGLTIGMSQQTVIPQTSGGLAGGSLERLQQAMGGILFGKTIDVTPIPPEPGDA